MDPVSAVDEVVDPIAEAEELFHSWPWCSACSINVIKRVGFGVTKFAIETMEIFLLGCNLLAHSQYSAFVIRDYHLNLLASEVYLDKADTPPPILRQRIDELWDPTQHGSTIEFLSCNSIFRCSKSLQ